MVLEATPVRVWIINPFDDLPNEGIRPGRYWSLADTLASRGHSVTWWSSNFSHRFKRFRSEVPVGSLPFAVRYVPTRPYSRNVSFARLANHADFARNFLGEARRLLAARELLPPDCMVVSLPPLGTPHAAFALRRTYGGRVVIDIQDAWPETFYRLVPGRGFVHSLLTRLVFQPWRLQALEAYRGADAITGVAKAYIDLGLKAKPDLPHHVTPIGVVLSDLDPLLSNDLCEGREFTFVYLGSISANYDLSTVILAARRIKALGYPFRVRLAGMGPDEARLRGLVDALGLHDTVEFMGFLDFPNVARLLSASDVALNPIIPESFCALPNKVGDYLGAGLPIISSIPGECRDLLESNGCGAFYLAKSVDSLTEKMVSYLSCKELAKEQGKRSRRLAECMFDRGTSYPTWVEFLEEQIKSFP